MSKVWFKSSSIERLMVSLLDRQTEVETLYEEVSADVDQLLAPVRG